MKKELHGGVIGKKRLGVAPPLARTVPGWFWLGTRPWAKRLKTLGISRGKPTYGAVGPHRPGDWSPPKGKVRCAVASGPPPASPCALTRRVSEGARSPLLLRVLTRLPPPPQVAPAGARAPAAALGWLRAGVARDQRKPDLEGSNFLSCLVMH